MNETKSIMEYVSQLMADQPRPEWMYDYQPACPEEVRIGCEVARIRYQNRAAKAAARQPQDERDDQLTPAQRRHRLYLKGPHWQAFRIAVLMLAGGACCKCGDVADDVHHLRYEDEHKNDVRHRERASDVEPLCRRCHVREHAGDEMRKLIHRMTA
jgi:5-methylcytosine-specific restriction endonuclease McrA